MLCFCGGGGGGASSEAELHDRKGILICNALSLSYRIAFLAQADALKKLGVDKVWTVAVADAEAMDNWAKKIGLDTAKVPFQRLRFFSNCQSKLVEVYV